MAAPSFLQVTPLAIDMSPNVVVRTISTSYIQTVRAANSNETATNGGFPTAQTAIVYRDYDQNNVRLRTMLTATTYASINTLLTA